MQADENGDGKLTLEEILQHQEAFYTTVYDETDDEDDDYDDYDYHGELRRWSNSLGILVSDAAQKI